MSASEAARRFTEAPLAVLPDPQPLPPELPPVPSFDPALLPGPFAAWVLDIAERMQCPPDFPAVGAMVALSAVVGRQVAIRPKRHDDWTVVSNLWGAVVGRPGIMKSPALAQVLKPLDRLEAQAREDHKAELRNHEASSAVGKQAAKLAEAEIKKALKAGDHDRAKREALALAVNDGEPPTRRRYQTQDPTVEKLGELLADNPRGVLVFRDELTGFLRNLDKEGCEGARAFYLEAWNGTGRFTYDRVQRGTVEIEAACVFILGGIQPGPFQDYLRAALGGGAGDDGLLQRFQLVAWPDPSPEWRNVDRWPDTPAKRKAWEVFEALDRIDPATIGAEMEEGELPFLRFQPGAQELFDEWRERLEPRTRSGEESAPFEAHLTKYRSLIPSLAHLCHLAEGNAGPVGERPILQALAWGEYLEQHARRMYAPALIPGLQAARELEKHIRKGDLPKPFTAREVYRNGWRLLDRDGTLLALEYLGDLDRILAEEVQPGDKGGRPSTCYRLHPAIREGRAP